MRRAANAIQVALALSLGTAALAAPTPAGTRITNVATFNADDTVTTSNAVTLTVREVCGVAITPGEQRAPGQVGQPVPFTFTVVNTGNATRSFPLTGSSVITAQGGVPATVTVGLNGQPLTTPSVTLKAGESRDVVLTVTAMGAGVAAGLLQASCASQTAEGKGIVQATLLPLTVYKTVSAAAAKPGDLLTYTVTVTNPNGVPVSGVTVTDTLDPNLAVLDVTPAAQQQGQTLTVALPPVPAAGSVTVTIRARVNAAADDVTVTNTAQTSSTDLPTPVPSNTVTTIIWDPKLVIEKLSTKVVATIGEHVPYTVTVRNASTTARLTHVIVTDTLPQGLSLTSGSLTLNGHAVTDLNPDPQVIAVDAGDLAPGGRATLQYGTVVTPAALGQATLRNVAVASATSATRPDATVRTPEVDAIIHVNSAERAVLLGRVFLDVNADGQFQVATDRPVKGARVIVAGGQAALTDAQGRYAIPGLRAGAYAVALDRASVPYAPSAGSLLLDGVQLLNVYGAATVDFPLQVPTGSAAASRNTLLTGDGWTLTKTLTRSGTTVTVALTLTAQRFMSLRVDDTLPPGSTLLDGRTSWDGTVSPGVPVAVQYTFASTLPDAALTTDPTVRAQGAAK